MMKKQDFNNNCGELQYKKTQIIDIADKKRVNDP